jgi:indolepyruvate ferredoxin oxidoreductase beta subunit
MNAPQPRVRPISIAILALGGEGGGVLADWIIDLAEHQGHLAQATSVPGVAQRTGATIYYVELFPRAAAQSAGRDPVLALMPVPGDVEVVLASELMEASRAIERGFVTPDRTTLVASTHRIYTMTERIALADRRSDAGAMQAACREAAKHLVAFDMDAMAEATGSVISAVLFGALAGSGALPFPRQAFEAAIRRHGVGVNASLAAFAAGFETASGQDAPATPKPGPAPEPLPQSFDTELNAQRAELGEETFALIRSGIARLIDYQGESYARDYLAHLEPFRAIDAARGGQNRLLAEVARELALAMSYEDTIRVAELKIRPQRFERVRGEVTLADGQILEIAEFFHPRTQEIADTLPASLGAWLLRTGWARRFVDRLTRKGKVVKTTSIRGFLLLYTIASMKRLRPRSLRFAAEQASLKTWLDETARLAATDYDLAVEFARCRGLIKGYGDTNERGRDKFSRLAALVSRLAGTSDAAATLSALRKAALADEDGKALAEAIAKLGPLSGR